MKITVLIAAVIIFTSIGCDKVDTLPILQGISQLKSQNDSLINLVVSLQTTLDSVQNRVNQNTTLLNTINNNITGLQNSVATLITNVTLLKLKLDSANVNVSAIQLQVTTLTKQYQNLSSQINLVFSSLSNKIDSLSLQTNFNTVLLNTLQINYLTTQIKVDSILLQIQINNQLLTSNNSNVSQIQTQLIALTTEYNNVITLLNQLIALINSQSVVNSLSNGLVAWYPFSGNANDSSGNGNNGTVYGATLTTDRFGNPNSAYYFNQNNLQSGTRENEIFINPSNSLNTKYLTVSAWIKIPYPLTQQVSAIINKFQNGYSNPNGEAWQIFLNNTTSSAQILPPNTTDIYTPAAPIVTGSIVSVNVWTHIAVTYDGNNFNIYTNGILVGTTLTNIQINTLGNSGISIGDSNQANGYWDKFIGSIDEVRIYNRPLSQSEITYLATH